MRLTSSDPDFGGLSGLRLSENGARFTAISDRGYWFTGEIVHEGTKPVALRGVEKSPTPGRDGKPLPGRKGFDTEGLEIFGKTAWITTERVNWLTRYALDEAGRPKGAGQAVALPKGATTVSLNAGYEGVARLGSGALMLVAQSRVAGGEDNRAYVIGPKTSFAFAIRRDDDFVPTDLARLPGGGLILMERRYRPPFSLSVRMKRLSEAEVAPGAVLDGPTLFRASYGQSVDNFEAISAHRGPDGRTVVSILSDDNFHPLQSTLLLQFALEK
ncbi:esterase-like activity of phytase family protein [Methylopila sp. M107]|uniref:esterase-like activity of phytase family protein n=1 Tax=Methylopila sp. M107 TaxID=1101190 RepID=UPI000364AEA2|nr:esterase-like activity of phytase family protein [Methylopila sp. M107]